MEVEAVRQALAASPLLTAAVIAMITTALPFCLMWLMAVVWRDN